MNAQLHYIKDLEEKAVIEPSEAETFIEHLNEKLKSLSYSVPKVSIDNTRHQIYKTHELISIFSVSELKP